MALAGLGEDGERLVALHAGRVDHRQVELVGQTSPSGTLRRQRDPAKLSRTPGSGLVARVRRWTPSTRRHHHRTDPLGTVAGAAFYFSPEAAARAEGIGLDVVSLYAAGRGAVLGDRTPDEVDETFFFFKPG